jgi:hypothetical protein
MNYELKAAARPDKCASRDKKDKCAAHDKILSPLSILSSRAAALSREAHLSPAGHPSYNH